MYARGNFEAPSCNHCCTENAASITRTYSESVFVALVAQHVMRMHRIILSSVANAARKYFSTLSHKCRDFRQQVIAHKMCGLNSFTPSI